MLRVVVILVVAGCTFALSDLRVVGGSTASEGQFPYQVSLRYNGKHDCGGSILDAKTVLTAAHCVSGRSSSGMTVGVGSNKLHGGDEYDVKTYIIHDDYNPFKIRHDIAIVKLRQPIEFGSGIEPVVLRKDRVGDDEEATLSGWGLTNFPGNNPNYLQFIRLSIIDYDTCARLQPKPVYTTQICTYTRKGEGACQGDSGGPLVDEDGKQIGIVSWGKPCARGLPDVYTEIYSYLEWIRIYRK